MRRLNAVLTTMLIFAISFSSGFAASSHVSQSLYFKSVNKRASVVILDINNKNLKPLVARADGGISLDQDLKSMADSYNAQGFKAVAGINGTYFSSYDGYPLPYGTIIEGGRVLHIGNYGSVIGFTQDNRVIMDNLNIGIEGYINDAPGYYAWGLNHPRSEDDAIIIFTPEFKDQISTIESKVVIVENGQVKCKIENGENLYIGENQFAIVFNKNVSNLAERFKIGDKVDYKFTFDSKNIDQSNDQNVKWQDVKYAIGAGPSLIIDGKITADGLAEGFYEAKINTARAQRSFIGVTGENKIIMGTVSNASVKEIAQICSEMGLKSAMCLDGGASSGLYYNGGYITRPGRKINNALIFVDTEVE